jgi:hypothetical protein
MLDPSDDEITTRKFGTALIDALATIWGLPASCSIQGAFLNTFRSYQEFCLVILWGLITETKSQGRLLPLLRTRQH